MELATGVVIDGLRLVSPLGAGAMGCVWSAHDEKLDRLVAVKFIAAGGALHPNALPRFKREATLVAKLKSPHVVQVFGHGLAGDDTPYIEMELLEGRTLMEELSANGPLALERASAILEQLARALTAAHALGIVHRDIKPSNVFLIEAAGYDVFVKVVDFGIAREVDGEDATLTNAGSVIGTPLYMSAQQLTGVGPIDEKADLWATAVVVYEMLVGRTPFLGANAAALAVAVERGAFPPPSEIVTGIPPAIDAWFEKALARDPVEQAVGRSATTGSVDVTPARSARAVAAPIAGLAAAGLAVFLLTRVEAPATIASSTAPSPSSVPLAPPSGAAPLPSGPRASPEPRRAGEGKLPPELIQSVIRARMPAIQACADSMGQLILRRTVHFTIGTDGRARDVELAELDGRAPAVDRCIVERFSALVFPKPEGGVIEAVYPVGFNPHGLALDDATCASTDACLANGQCTAVGDGCRAATDADCALSRACTERGECTAEKGRCRASHQDCAPGSVACSKFGLCALHEGRCRATSDEACGASEGCKRYGLCAERDGSCRATTDEMCAASTGCTGSGRCERRRFGCGALTDASCKASGDCRVNGMCRVHADRCVAKDDADCGAADLCRDRGACRAGAYGRCIAKSEEDCKRSKSCKDLGACSLRGYTCEAD